MAVDFEREVYCLLGLPFDAMGMEAAAGLVRKSAAERKELFFSTANLNFLIGCRTDGGFRDSVINSDLSIADGLPLIWLARLLEIPIRERVAGSDLFDWLAAGRTSPPLSVFFFGGGEGVAEAACRNLNAAPSGLRCAGFDFPGFGSVEEMSRDETVAKINASGADIVVVSLGAKKGQAWIERNRARLAVPAISHLGAVLNYAAGTLSRAPVWMRENGLEWLWRVKEEPALWRRYLGDGMAFLSLLATSVLPYWWYLRRHRVEAAQLAEARLEAADEGDVHVVQLRGPWTTANIAPLRRCFTRAALTGKDVILDMAGVTAVDAAFLGLAMLLHGHQKRNSRRLLMRSLQKPVRQTFRYCQAEFLCLNAG